MRELSLHLLDVMENALRAGARRIAVEIDENPRRNLLTLRVRDDGHGVAPDALGRLGDPFYTTRTTRSVGMGLALLRAAARRCNGDLVVRSRSGQGTEVTATFELDHIDRAPLGDVKATLLGALMADGECDVAYRHAVGDREFTFDSAHLRDALGDVPLSHPRVREWIEDHLDGGIAELYRGVEEEEHA